MLTWKITRLNIFLLCLLGAYSSVGAQNQTFRWQGKVVDSLSKTPLAFVNISIVGTTTGSNSNIDGVFNLNLHLGDRVRFSYVGYADKVFSVTTSLLAQKVILFSEKDVLLNEFVITPAINPAWRIIRNALANRSKNNPDYYDNYQYRSYNKSIIHFDLLSEGSYAKIKRQKDSLKNVQKNRKVNNYDYQKLLKEQMYLWLKETVVQVAHRRPNQTKERILAHKSSLPNDFSGGFIPTDFQPLGFYQEIIRMDVVGQSYINPLSNNCFERYDFVLENTFSKDLDTTFVISFAPRRQKNFNGFKGIFYINSAGYAIENVIAETVDTLSKLQMRIRQQSKKSGEQWFPEVLDTDISILMGNDKMGLMDLMVHNRSYLEEVALNQTLSPGTFSYAQREEALLPGYRQDSVWQSLRTEPLNPRESNTYQYWDTLEALKPIRNFLHGYNGVIRVLATDRLPIGSALSLRMSDLLRFNNYEGTRLGIGGVLQFPTAPWFALGASAGYGFKDKSWKYAAYAETKLLTAQDLKLRVSYQKDLAEPGAPSMLTNTYRLLSVFTEPRNVYRYRFDQVLTKRVDLYWRPTQGLQLNPFWYDENRKILAYDYSYGTEKKTSSFDLVNYGLNLRWAPKEVVYKKANLESIFALTFPILDVQWSRGILAAQNINFSKTELSLTHQLISKSLGKSMFRLSVGKIWGDVPYPYLFNAPGSRLNRDLQILIPRTFQVAGFYEFAGDQYAYLFWEQNFGELLYKSKSKYSRPSISLVQHLGWSDLHNSAVNSDPLFSTMKKGYYETGLYLRDLYRVPYFDMYYLSFGVGSMMRWGPYHQANWHDNYAFQFIMRIGF